MGMYYSLSDDVWSRSCRRRLRRRAQEDGWRATELHVSRNGSRESVMMDKYISEATASSCFYRAADGQHKPRHNWKPSAGNIPHFRCASTQPTTSSRRSAAAHLTRIRNMTDTAINSSVKIFAMFTKLNSYKIDMLHRVLEAGVAWRYRAMRRVDDYD